MRTISAAPAALESERDMESEAEVTEDLSGSEGHCQGRSCCGGRRHGQRGASGALQEPLEQIGFETMEVSHRFRSPTLLLWGGIFGMVGFVLAFAIGLVDFFLRRDNRDGHPYLSGHGYWPSTVSEMVYSWNSPQGRIFFGCCLVSAFLIFSSWYPYQLRNVFTGPEVLQAFGYSTYWITFRQLVPVCGLLLLICVSTVPAYIAEPTDYFSIGVHLMGAFMMFGGYIVAELKCLAICGFRSHSQMKYLDIEPDERCARVSLMVTVVVCYVLFCLFQVVLVWANTDARLCCHDTYVDEQGESAQLNSSQKLHLQDTASGAYMYLKILSFMAEVIAGIALIASHLVVWYYCEERHVDFGRDALLEVYDEENRVELRRSAATAATASHQGHGHGHNHGQV